MSKDQAKRIVFSWPMVILSLMWLSLFMQTDMAARWHGRLMPVTGPIQVTEVTPAMVQGVAGTRIRGVAKLNRAECDYINVEWQLNGDSKSVSVTAFFMDKPQVRKEGMQEWEALMVGIPPNKLKDTTGTVIHECGRFPVMTPFFIPDESIVPTTAGATAECTSGAYTTSTGPGTCSGHGGVKEWLM